MINMPGGEWIWVRPIPFGLLSLAQGLTQKAIKPISRLLQLTLKGRHLQGTTWITLATTFVISMMEPHPLPQSFHLIASE